MLSHRNLAHMKYSYYIDVDAVPQGGRGLSKTVGVPPGTQNRGSIPEANADSAT